MIDACVCQLGAASARVVGVLPCQQLPRQQEPSRPRTNSISSSYAIDLELQLLTDFTHVRHELYLLKQIPLRVIHSNWVEQIRTQVQSQGE